MKNFIQILVFILSGAVAFAVQPKAVKGVLDLREHQFSKDETFELTGVWEVYPSKLYNAADFLNDPTLSDKEAHYAHSTFNWATIPELKKGYKEYGYATYRLRIIMPKEFPKQALMLRDVNTAYKLFINGNGVEGSGDLATNAQQGRPNWRHATTAINLEPGPNEIILQVSNFHHAHGGLTKPILMGNSDKVFFIRNLEIGGILFLAGCLLLAGIFALGLFWFKTTDVLGLFFFLFCSSFAIFIINSGPHLFQALFKNLSWEFTVKLMWVSLYSSITFYGYFLLKSFSEYFKPQLFHVLAGLSGLMAILTVLAPIPLISQVQVYYYSLVIISLVFVILSGIQQASFSHKLSWINTLGTIALLLVILHMVASYLNLTGYWPMFYVVSLTVFIFSQALVMAIKFGRNYRESSLAALAAAKTRDEFLNAMSHELKTPMNAILGMSTFLEKSDLKPRQRDKLSAIKKNAESLMSMINDVLSISELGSGQLKLSRSVMDLQNCVESAIGLSRQYLKKDSVRFIYDIDPNIPSPLIGDGSRLKQILMHLLNNAFRFTEEGMVVLKVSTLETKPGSVKVHFSISDTGVGMSHRSKGRNILSIITHDQANKIVKYPNGSGMGLSVTRQLLELMGGKLELTSKKGVGTEVNFDIEFQEYVEETRHIRPYSHRDEIDTSLKILYAEDNPVNRKLIQMMLKALNLEVDLAENGREAVQMAMKKYYNIILMDIQMPEMDGMEATRKIVDNSTARPIIIATTANLAEVDKRKCFEAGMNDFLSKPIHQEDLKLAILKWQGLKKYLDDTTGDTIKLSS